VWEDDIFLEGSQNLCGPSRLSGNHTTQKIMPYFEYGEHCPVRASRLSLTLSIWASEMHKTSMDCAALLPDRARHQWKPYSGLRRSKVASLQW